MNADSDAQAESQQLYETRQLDALAARWDAKAATWDHALEAPSCHLNEDEAYERFVVEASQIITERENVCSKQGLIDLGCGTGLVLSRLVHSFAWAIGLDISHQMVSMAKRKNIPKASFLVGDAFCLPELCPPAGAIVSRGILLSHYGIEAGEMLLRAARKTLVPGGFVLFDFLNEAARANASHAPENKTYFTGTELKAMVERVGCERMRIVGESTRRVRLLFAELKGSTK